MREDKREGERKSEKRCVSSRERDRILYGVRTYRSFVVHVTYNSHV